MFLIFAQTIDGYPQSMFWSQIRKIGLPLHTPILLYKSGIQGVYITRACYVMSKWTTTIMTKSTHTYTKAKQKL